MNKAMFALFTILVFSIGCSTQKHSVSKPDAFVLGDRFNASKEKALNACESIVENNIVPITAPLAKKARDK